MTRVRVSDAPGVQIAFREVLDAARTLGIDVSEWKLHTIGDVMPYAILLNGTLREAYLGDTILEVKHSLQVMLEAYRLANQAGALTPAAAKAKKLRERREREQQGYEYTRG